MRILLAEQDVQNAHATMKSLAQAGFLVDFHDRGDDALEMTRHFDYDVVLLNEDLPGIGGLDMLRQMRRARRDLPVVILTASQDPHFKTEAFGMGADDVLTRPMDPAELVARLHAIIRRSRGLNNSVVRLGELELNFNSAEVAFGGKPIRLTGKEFSILQLLILRRGTVLTKDAFMNHLYGGMDEPEMKIVDVFICKLRRKLQLAGAPNLIVTVWGRGYMLREGRTETLPAPKAQPTVTSTARHYTTA